MYYWKLARISTILKCTWAKDHIGPVLLFPYQNKFIRYLPWWHLAEKKTEKHINHRRGIFWGQMSRTWSQDLFRWEHSEERTPGERLNMVRGWLQSLGRRSTLAGSLWEHIKDNFLPTAPCLSAHTQQSTAGWRCLLQVCFALGTWLPAHIVVVLSCIWLVPSIPNQRMNALWQFTYDDCQSYNAL